MTTVYAQAAHHIHMLHTLLDHEGHLAFWYVDAARGTALCTDAPIEVVTACIHTVNTALRLRGARAMRT